MKDKFKDKQCLKPGHRQRNNNKDNNEDLITFINIT